MLENQSTDNKTLSYSVEAATKVAGIGMTKLYAEINAGRLKAKKFGKRTLIPASALNDWIDNLPDYKITKN
jgi:excisionase family DNA binding protein